LLLEHLYLRHFRNYQSLLFSPAPGLNILAGPNAAGKTNVLEAIYYLAFGRSHRALKDSEMVTRGHPGFYIKGAILKDRASHSIEFRYHSECGKAARLDGLPQRLIGDLLGVFNVVLFSPDDLDLAKGGPAGRRAFIDRALTQVSPAYYSLLNRYNRTLAQRNRLLKELGPGCGAGELAALEPWTERLASEGAEVMERRNQALTFLAKAASSLYQDVAGSEEDLTVEYRPALGDMEQIERDEDKRVIRGVLRTALESQYKEELRRSHSLLGPHRDDIHIAIDQQPVRYYGSQGQQRSAVLALKLAERQWIEHVTGDQPVVLLDDVLSELDDQRSQRLTSLAASAGQSFITTTGVEHSPLGQVKSRFQVQDGDIRAWPEG